MSASLVVATRGSRWRTFASLVAAAACLSLVGLFAAPSHVYAADPTPGAPATTPTPLTPDQQRIENVIAAARQYVGVPYRVGSEGPTLFDCSGLVFRAFSDAGLVDRIGGQRLRAAGYMRWFAAKGMMTTDESQAQRGDLVIYESGAHIGIYLGDGRVISALLTGVTVHSLHGISLPATGFLRPDWSGDGSVAPFVPVTLPDVPEAPATLVPASSWMPTLDPSLSAPATREGLERTDLRTLNSRTFENADGTFTTEFHAQPIFYQPAGTTSPSDLQPIDLSFVADAATGYASVSTSPVVVTTRPAGDPAGFVSATSGMDSVSLALAAANGTASGSATPQVVDGDRVVDFFDFQPQHVGLRVLAQTDGFKTFLVMAREPQRTKYSFVLDARGIVPVAADDGSVLLTDASGATVGRIPRPLLLDSSDDDGNGDGLFTAATSLSLDTSGALPVITVSIDRAFLDEAVYPAYVDMSLTNFPQVAAGADVTFASSSHPNVDLHGYQRPESSGFDELWLGRQPGSKNNNEIYVRFDGLAATLGTVDVAAASLELLPYFEQAGDGMVDARQVTSVWNADALDWANRPATSATDIGQLTGAAGAWAALDVSDYVTGVLSRGQADFGLLLAGDGTKAAAWERLAASDAGAAAEFGPRLVVTWSGLRPAALPLVAAPGADWSIAPTLTWAKPQLAPAQVRYEVQLSLDSFATVAFDSGAIKGKHGATESWTLPADVANAVGDYQWRVRARYGSDATWSPWSSPQPLTISGPPVPHAVV
ncbi:MAG TPA: DNRLRE domain-containing protein [Candidatus Limnocylindrales bacterium]